MLDVLPNVVVNGPSGTARARTRAGVRAIRAPRAISRISGCVCKAPL